jgi:hypothetical protein
MEKIIDIRKRIESQKNSLQLKRYWTKIDTLRRVTQCSSCRLKCSMCGQYLDNADSSCNAGESDRGYTFCDPCREEYEDFLALSRGKGTPKVFWHNKEWKRMWSAWLRYRQAINDFFDSPEFDIMLEELENKP